MDYPVGWLPYRVHLAVDAAEGLALLARIAPRAALINAHSEAQQELSRACTAAGVAVICLHCLAEPVTAEELGSALRAG